MRCTWNKNGTKRERGTTIYYYTALHRKTLWYKGQSALPKQCATIAIRPQPPNRKRGDRENFLYTAQPGHCQLKRPQAVANLRSKRPEIAEPNRGDAATNRDIRQKGMP